METLLKNLRNGGSKPRCAIIVRSPLFLSNSWMLPKFVSCSLIAASRIALQIVMRRIDVQRRDIRTAGLVEVASVVLNLLAQDNVEQ